jgi:hypothetical protein
MSKPTDDGIERLKYLYSAENVTSNMITYDKFNFSLNVGDYQEPFA